MVDVNERRHLQVLYMGEIKMKLCPIQYVRKYSHV